MERTGDSKHFRFTHSRILGSKANKSALPQSNTKVLKTFIRTVKRKGTINAVDSLVHDADIENKHFMGYTFSYIPPTLYDPEIDKYYSFLNKIDDELDFFNKEFEQDQRGRFTKKRRCLINPDGRFKVIFDHLLLLCILYVGIFSTFKLGFVKILESPLWAPADMMTDTIFFLDLVFTFFTPSIIDNELVDDHCKLAKKYLQSWFWIDLAAIIPYDLLIEELSDTYKVVVSFSTIPRIYKLLKMTRLLRTVRAAKSSDTVISRFISSMLKSEMFLISIAPLYILILFISHTFACIWYFISDNDDPNSWINLYGYSDESLFDRYISSLYFTYTTLTTTGYGDLTPHTEGELFATILFVGVGVTVCSFIFSTMLEKFVKMNEASDEFLQKKKLLQELKESGIFKKSSSVYVEIKESINQQFGENDEDAIEYSTDMFPKVIPSVKEELIQEVCETKYRFDITPFIQDIDRDDWSIFFSGMKTIKYTKGTMIIDKGTKPNYFYVIRRGRVWFLHSDYHLIYNPFVEVDSFFGEFELFEGRNARRFWSVFAATDVILYQVPKRTLIHTLNDAETRARFIKCLNERLSEFRKIERHLTRNNRRAHKIRNRLLTEKTITKKDFMDRIVEMKQSKGSRWRGFMHNLFSTK